MITKQINAYDSSTVISSEYSFKSKMLYVFFSGNQKDIGYKYKDVEVEDYLEFANAESQGKTLNSVIKNKYEYEKIG